jgi:predicted RNase H-like HicB family nuclease
MELIARIHEEDGAYWAEVIELPGCFASGATLDDLREALEESVAMYLADGAEEAAKSGRPQTRRALRVGEMKVLV